MKIYNKGTIWNVLGEREYGTNFCLSFPALLFRLFFFLFIYFFFVCLFTLFFFVVIVVFVDEMIKNPLTMMTFTKDAQNIGVTKRKKIKCMKTMSP